MTPQEKYFLELIIEASKLYFDGKSIKEQIDTKGFYAIQKERGSSGLCYEFSSIAMLLLKNNPTAKLCRGSYYDLDGNFKTRHSWVEFSIPSDGVYVADFSWMSPGFCSAIDYYHHADSEGKLVKQWVCTYEKFWEFSPSEKLYKKIKQPETSFVLTELIAYGIPEMGYEFLARPPV